MAVLSNTRSSPSRNPSGALPAEDLVLFALLAFRKANKARVAEYTLHKSVHFLSDLGGLERFRFISQPITFSYQLLNCLRSMERKRLLDELVYVHDSWAPQHLYELTSVGVVEAEDRLESALAKGALSSPLVDALSKPRLLPPEKESDDPAHDKQD